MIMRLYGNRQSRAARCLWLLEELGIPFEQIAVDMANGQNRKADYLALNPAGKIPTLVADDFVVTESVAINFYLAARRPTPLWPDEHRTRAHIQQWSSWAVTEMEVPFTLIVRQRRAAAANGQEPDPQAFDALTSEARETMATIERALADDCEYLVGGDFTLADINAATAVMIAPMFLDMTAFPATTAWLARCHRRPSWSRVMARP